MIAGDAADTFSVFRRSRRFPITVRKKAGKFMPIFL